MKDKKVKVVLRYGESHVGEREWVVESVTNTLEVGPGQSLNQGAVQDLIDTQGWTVQILQAS